MSAGGDALVACSAAVTASVRSATCGDRGGHVGGVLPDAEV